MKTHGESGHRNEGNDDTHQRHQERKVKYGRVTGELKDLSVTGSHLK